MASGFQTARSIRLSERCPQHLRHDEARLVPRAPAHDGQATNCQAQGIGRGNESPPPRVDQGAGRMARCRHVGLLWLSWSPRKQQIAAILPLGGGAAAVSQPVPEESQETAELEQDAASCKSLASSPPDLPSISRRTLQGTPSLKVRARCGSAARRDLCGGLGDHNPSPYRERPLFLRARLSGLPTGNCQAHPRGGGRRNAGAEYMPV